MPMKLADVAEEYRKNKDLRAEDVKALREWAERQPHLPRATDLQLIIILQSCYFSIEAAKNTMDAFYTIRTHYPEMFAELDPRLPAAQLFMDTCVWAPLPKPTPENYRVIYTRLVDTDPEKFVLTQLYKYFDMTLMLWMSEQGTSEGLVMVLDMDGLVFGHFLKLGVLNIKKFLIYLQDALPVRLKGLHFINIVSFMDKILALMKPFMKKELMDVLYTHKRGELEEFYKFVPQACLTKDLGGEAESFTAMHDQLKKRLLDNVDFFLEEEKLIVDESKRPGKPKNSQDLFGVEGSFKSLNID